MVTGCGYHNRRHCQSPSAIAAKASRCHNGMADQTPARMQGASICSMTIPTMAATRFGTAAGFTMPSMHPKAVRTSAMIASNPKSIPIEGKS